MKIKRTKGKIKKLLKKNENMSIKKKYEKNEITFGIFICVYYLEIYE